MLRSLALVLALLLFACGGEEPADSTPTNGGGNGAGDGSGDLQTLNVPPGGEEPTPAKPAPEPVPVDPQAAIFSKAESLIQSSDSEDRMMAIVALKEAEDQARAGRYVARLLFDRDEEVRIVAAESIGQFDYAPGADNIRTLLTDEKSPDVRKAALLSLYALAKEKALGDLVKVLKEDDEPTLRATAAGLLGRIGSKEAVEPLIATVVNSFDDDVILQALVALRKIGDPQAADAADAAIEALEYSSVLVRTEAARTLGELGEKKAIGPLVGVLAPEADSQLLSAAVTSLVQLTGVEDENMQLASESTFEEQEAAIAAWKKWWEENKAGAGD
jgi:HEAT repeat protein